MSRQGKIDKNLLYKFLSISCFIAVVALLNASAAAPAGAVEAPVTPEQQAALDRMNAYRRLAGVGPLAAHPALNRAAVNHATYYMLNAAGDPDLRGSGLHNETPGRPGFTGADIGARIRGAGYEGRWNEGMALLGDPVRAVDVFMRLVNHRLPILDPAYTEAGYGGGREGRTVVDVLTYGGPYRGGPAPEWIAWPPDGLPGAPTSYDGNETSPAFPGASYPVGAAITLKYTGAGTLALTEAHLAGPDGHDLLVLTRLSYNMITRNVAVVAAQRPLAPHTRYSVRLAGTIDGRAWSRAWSFTTGAGAAPALAPAPPAADAPLQGVWARTDWPLAADLIPARGWVWGPGGWATREEPYREAPAGRRLVRYFDKARMEITDPAGNPADPWFVTNGLLVWEMIAGQVQVGDRAYQPRAAAQEPVAGDPRPANPDAPSYAALRGITSIAGDNPAPNRTGATIIETVDRAGRTDTDPDLARHNVRAGYYAPETRHNVSDRFWAYLQTEGQIYRGGYLATGPLVSWVYAAGYPISEPYWTTARINGQRESVLVQLFQRRTLTYMPSFDPAWQVQMGNVGQHYHSWRYPP
jgi:uncharacterized protein YkwD